MFLDVFSVNLIHFWIFLIYSTKMGNTKKLFNFLMKVCRSNFWFIKNKYLWKYYDPIYFGKEMYILSRATLIFFKTYRYNKITNNIRKSRSFYGTLTVSICPILRNDLALLLYLRPAKSRLKILREKHRTFHFTTCSLAND